MIILQMSLSMDFSKYCYTELLMANSKCEKICLDISAKKVSNLHETLTQLSSAFNKNGSSPILLIVNDNQLVNLKGVSIVSQIVEEIKAHNNQIVNLGGMESLSFPMLERLYLEYNQVNSIDELRSCNFPKLTRLTLSGNRLTTSEAQVLQFLNAPRLLILGLDENQLTQVNFISAINASLLYLDLTHNQISSIDFLKSYKFGRKLSKLLLSSNKIERFPSCHCDFSNLATLTLNSNSLASVQGFRSCSFSSLEMLNLESNNLTTCRFLATINAPKLVDLKMSGNLLSEFRSIRSSYFPKIQQILLNQNRISNNVLNEIVIALNISNPKESPFRILRCWKNSMIVKKEASLFAKMRIHFPKLSFFEF